MGKSTISMAIFHSYFSLLEGKCLSCLDSHCKGWMMRAEGPKKNLKPGQMVNETHEFWMVNQVQTSLNMAKVPK